LGLKIGKSPSIVLQKNRANAGDLLKQLEVANNVKDLNGKVIIISGASSGIGRATALALAEYHPRLVLASRNKDALEKVAQDVQRLGGDVMVCETDVTDPAQVSQMVHQGLTEWGQIDLLITSNGQYIRGSIHETSIEEMYKSLEVNFLGCFHLTKAVLPAMLLQNTGHIIFISSMIAKKALPYDIPYVAAKYALSGYADALRQELHRTGVSVTTIFPARIDTPFVKDFDFSWVARPDSPETVAKVVYHAIHTRKAEIILPIRANILHYINVLSPKTADWAVRAFRLESRIKN
jgi:hypothetical protein